MDKLTSEIRKKGLSMPQFCDKILGVDYKAFRARVRQQRLRLSEIKLIIIYTNISFEDLFMTDDDGKGSEPRPVAEPVRKEDNADPQIPPPDEPPKTPPNNGGYIESY